MAASVFAIVMHQCLLWTGLSDNWAALTGRGADLIIIDDPLKPDEVGLILQSAVDKLISST